MVLIQSDKNISENGQYFSYNYMKNLIGLKDELFRAKLK